MQAGLIDNLGQRLELLKLQSDCAERFDLGFYLPYQHPAAVRSLAEAALQDQNRSGYTVTKALKHFVDAESEMKSYNKLQTDSCALQTTEDFYIDVSKKFHTPGPKGLADKNRYVSALAGIDDYLEQRGLELPAKLVQRYKPNAGAMHEVLQTASLASKTKHPAIQYVDACDKHEHYMNGDYEQKLRMRAFERRIDEKKEIQRVQSYSKPAFFRDLVSAVSMRPAKRVLTKALDSPNASSESICSAIECYVGNKAWQADLKASFRSLKYAIYGGYASSMDTAAEHEARHQAVNVLVEHADCQPEKFQLISQALLSQPTTRAIVFERKDVPRRVEPNMADPRVELRHLESSGALTRLDLAQARRPSLERVAKKASSGHRPIEPDLDLLGDYLKRPESSTSSSSGGGSSKFDDFAEKVYRLASRHAPAVVDLEKTSTRSGSQRTVSLQKRYAKLLTLRRHAVSTQAIGDAFDEKSAVRGDLLNGRAGAERTIRVGGR